MAPPVWSQVLGLLLFVLVVAVAVGVHRAYVAVVRRRVYRAAVRPLPGRTRDIVRPAARRAS